MLSRGFPSAEILWMHGLFKTKSLNMSKQLKKGPKAKKLRPDILEVKFG
jgi:hypothetical protein